jgi:ParB/RepB/Spo0J family partition protein
MATTTTADTHDRQEVDLAPNGGVQLRHIPLSRVVVPESFNPRGEVTDDRELEQLADSIRTDGCLQPIRVRATDHGDYILIAGERRYRAAVKASVMELPAIIRPAGTGGDDEQSDLLVEALLENDLRRDLDPLARARGYQRLIDTGLTPKGVAERLQTTQARVREHLRILKLPEELQDKLASGEIPYEQPKRSHSSPASTPGSPSRPLNKCSTPATNTSRTHGPTSSTRRSRWHSPPTSCPRASTVRTPRTRSRCSR